MGLTRHLGEAEPSKRQGFLASSSDAGGAAGDDGVGDMVTVRRWHAGDGSEAEAAMKMRRFLWGVVVVVCMGPAEVEGTPRCSVGPAEEEGTPRCCVGPCSLWIAGAATVRAEAEPSLPAEEVASRAGDDGVGVGTAV